MYSNSLSPKRTSCNLSKGWIFWLFLFCGCSEHRDLIPVGPPPNQDPEIRSLEVNPLPIAIDLTAQVVAEVVDPDGDELEYLWTATAGTISGDGPSATWQAPSQKGLQTISLEVRDSRDGKDSREVTFTVITPLPNNDNPVINSLTAQPDTVQITENSTIRVDADDPDGDPLSYSWSKSGGTLNRSGSQVTWTAPIEVGTYVVSVSVSDDKGGSAGGSISLFVYSNNTPPVVTGVSAEPEEIKVGESTTLTARASDPEGDPLSYTWSISGGGGEISGSGTQVTWTAPVAPPCCAPGDYIIKVEADDGKGGKAEGSVKVTVTL